MPKYEKVSCDPRSDNFLVQACLQKKIIVATSESPDKISGIASQSCFSVVYAKIKDKPEPQMIFGNSRNFVPYKVDKLARTHGELDALWQAIEENDGLPEILGMYIEIHPCRNCAEALDNLLPQDQIVYYSFEYPDELAKWGIAARELCHL